MVVMVKFLTSQCNSFHCIQAFCFLAAILYGLVVVWVAIYMVKEWNDKVVKYTLKEAVTG